MTSTSCVIVGQTLKWKTKISLYDVYESPIFSYMQLKWKLRISTFCETQFNTTYFSIILKNCSGISSSKKFEISTSFEKRMVFHDTQIQCSKITDASDSQILWVLKCDLAEEKLFLSQNQEDVIITCVFFPNAGLSLDVKAERNDKSTRMEFPDLQNERSLTPAVISSMQILQYALNMVQNLENLSKDMSDIFDKNVLPDVVLKCGEVNIQAHKAVLATRSNIFSLMFQDPIHGSNKDTIEIKDIDSSVLHDFLKFLYSGKISDNLTIDMISQLYLASHNYRVSMLQKECARLIVSSLNEENCFQMLEIAELHADQLFMDGLADFITERPKLMKEDSWIKFSDKSPKLAIQIYQKFIEKCFPK